MKNFIKIALILALLLIVAGCTNPFEINSISITSPQYIPDMSCANIFNKGCSLSTTTIGFTETLPEGDGYVYYAICLPNNVEKASYYTYTPSSTAGNLNSYPFAGLASSVGLPQYTDCTWERYKTEKIAVNKAGGNWFIPGSQLPITDYIKFKTTGTHRISFAFTAGPDDNTAKDFWVVGFKDIAVYGCKSDGDCPAAKPYCDASKNCVCISSAEVCDGKDNDCDAQVDELWPKTLNCPGGCGGTYREDCTRGVLTDTKASCPSSYTCMDYSTCRESVSCSPCTSAPSDEWCDSRDNDCDGITDNGCDDDNDDFCDNTIILSGFSKICPKGGGDADDNDNTVYPGAPELCDNKDNDQNGFKDDMADIPMNCGYGVCQASGFKRCINGVWEEICTPNLAAKSSEGKNFAGTCSDTLDNDCDGTVDMNDFDCFCKDVEMKCGHKVEAPDGSVVDYDVCSEDGTSKCCASNKDCVVGGVCYNYVRGMNPPSYNIQGNDLVCSVGVWCPKGFSWDSITNKCVPRQASCFPIPCDNPDPLTPEWFNNPSCTNYAPKPNQACCLTTVIAGVNYYNFVPYTVY